MKNFSNKYIFIFSSVMVVIVAALLSIVALMLKPAQDQNVKAETMQNILSSIHIESTRANAEELFNKNISKSYVIDIEGQPKEGVTALSVNLAKEKEKIDRIKNLENSIREVRESPFKKFLAGFINIRKSDVSSIKTTIQKERQERLLPVYESVRENDTVYIFPLYGKGLWGPIWGFVALQSDMNTIYGAVFDHKGETPGLGAEINLPWFESAFNGKKLYEDGKFVSVEVVKGGTSDDNPHGVDAISGGTITSNGLEAMLYDNLVSYERFFEKKRK